MHARRLLLALDQGTTSSRAMVYDAAGRVVGSAQRPFPQLYPQPGLVEHDPEALWTTQRDAAEAAIAAAGATARDLVAVGIANQRETTVVWERATGRPLGNAIVWQDRRTAAACERLRAEGLEPVVAERTGLRLDPYFSATKLQWLLDHHDGARQRAERGELCFGTVDSWLLFRLTGGRLHATDATNASRTLLFDVHRGDWDDELLRVFGVPRAMLPVVVDSSARLATVDASLPFAGVPIAGVAGDQQAALFGQLCHRAGEAKLTYGTGCFLLQHTGTQAVRSKNRLLTTIASRIGGVTTYALEGAVFVGGALVQWLRDELGIVRSAQELDELAAGVPDAGGVFVVPAFAGLGAPYWDPRARGAILGLTRGSGRAQLCRAALEAIALQCADLLDCMRADSGLSLAELRVDGGAANSAPLLQIQADLLGVPLVRPADVETTARGAAWLAGLAVGFWPDVAALAQLPCESSRIEPRGDPARSQALRQGWQRAVSRTLN